MNKVKAFLEKNAQWLAMAVGGLWLLYMVYAHVLASPNASVDVKGNTLGPGSVDQFIDDNAIQKIKNDMSYTGTLPQLKEDYPAIVRNQMSLSGDAPVALASNLMNSTQIVTGPQPPIKTTLPPIGAQPVVNALVVPPAPIKVDVVVGKSIITDPNAVVAPGGQQQVRRLWATIFGTLPMADLNKAFAAAGVNGLAFPSAQQTLVLKVEVIRTEQLSNLAFGNPTTIVTNYMDLNAVTPAQPLAWPPNNLPNQLAFKDQATANQKIICQPAFFQVNKGDNWRMPGEALVPVGVVAPPPAPVAPPPPTNPRQRPPVTPRPVTPPRTPTHGPNGLLPVPEIQKQRIMLQQVFTDNGLPPAPGTPFTNPNTGAAPGAPLPAPNLIGQPPAGLFMPSNAADINLWVHDLNVQSGKTYQYQMRYTILNPVFLSPNCCPPNGKQWAQQFSIDSPLSAPVPQAGVQIPDTTSFFASSYVASKNSVKFDIFVWDVNGVVRTTVSAEPGDLIDPNLKLTLVDARRVGAEDTVVLLMDENGTISTRSIKADSRSPVYDNLKREADASKPVTP